MHKFRVFFYNRQNPLTLIDLVPLSTSVNVGDIIMLPQHMIALHKMPDWVLKQGAWKVKNLIRRVRGLSVEDADILILTPTSDPLLDLFE